MSKENRDRFIILFLISFFYLGSKTWGQLALEVTPPEAAAKLENLKPAFQKKFGNEAEARSYLQEVVNDLRQQGYLEASFDSLTLKDTLLTVDFHAGEYYTWAVLQTKNVDNYVLNKAGFREAVFAGKPVRISQLRKLKEDILTELNNNGYPFARVILDSFRIVRNQVTALLVVEKNQLILYDKPEVEGDARISPEFLARYTGIEEGGIYNESKIKRVRTRFKELPFVEEKKEPQIRFRGERAGVTFFLDKKKASRFDFLIGVLPNNEEFGRLLVTGSFTGEMHNQFGVGERIFAEYEQLRPETREINMAFNYPYILNTSFGADFDFNLYKRDISYLDVSFEIGMRYMLEAGSYVKAFWKQSNSTLLTIDTLAIINTRMLPSSFDFRNSAFGVEYSLYRLDYRFNPREGWSTTLLASAEVRNIDKNQNILNLQDPSEPAFDFEMLYDSLTLRSFQVRLEAKAQKFFPVFSNQAVRLAFTSAFILSEFPVFFNEQYRIGGNRLLRGFDEESIFATNYGIATVEYRLLTGQNSYISVFGDFGRIEDRTNLKNSVDYPLGFGAGITFETNVGVFGVSYALGRQQGNPIDFGSGKIHFGYVSLF